jgi:hypothetical protein
MKREASAARSTLRDYSTRFLEQPLGSRFVFGRVHNNT